MKNNLVHSTQSLVFLAELLLMSFLVLWFLPVHADAWLNNTASTFAPIYIQSHVDFARDQPGLLLIVHDLDQNTIKPYFFPINQYINFIGTDFNARKYRILEAQLITNFGTINKYCHIVRRRPAIHETLKIHFHGVIDHNLANFHCRSQYEKNLDWIEEYQDDEDF